MATLSHKPRRGKRRKRERKEEKGKKETGKRKRLYFFFLTVHVANFLLLSRGHDNLCKSSGGGGSASGGSSLVCPSQPNSPSLLLGATSCVSPGSSAPSLPLTWFLNSFTPSVQEVDQARPHLTASCPRLIKSISARSWAGSTKAPLICLDADPFSCSQLFVVGSPSWRRRTRTWTSSWSRTPSR